MGNIQPPVSIGQFLGCPNEPSRRLLPGHIKNSRNFNPIQLE